MSRIARLALFAAVLVATTASTADAVTWHNTGSTAFTATGGPTTLTVGGSNLLCATSTATAAVAAAPSVGATWSAFGGTTTFGCTVIGVPVVVDCAYAFTAQSWTSGAPAVTTGTLDMTCGMLMLGTTACHLAGTLAGTYANPAGATNGKLTLSTGGTLVTSNPASGTCPMGPGARAHLRETTLTVSAATGGTGTGGPVITRTA